MLFRSKRDLSLDPTLLGDAFAAWTKYKDYTENPSAAASPPSISPAYGSDPVRRRHVMTPHVISDGGSHQVAPVVNYFLITFNVRTVDGSKGNQPLEVRARWMVSLWNPYTSALVPEDLRIEVSGLPSNIRVNNVSDDPERARPLGAFSLGSAYGTPLRINLPWTPNAAGDADRQSWLPGRVYTWRSLEDKTKPEDVPSDGFPSYFYSQTLNDSGAGVIRPLGLAKVDGDLVEFLGWETRKTMLDMPVRDFGYGIRSHYRASSALRPMGQLITGIKKARGEA